MNFLMEKNKSLKMIVDLPQRKGTIDLEKVKFSFNQISSLFNFALGVDSFCKNLIS